MTSTPKPRLSRRHLAAGSGALLSLAGAGARASAAAASPDAELIEHCAAFDALERQFLATDFDAPRGTAAAIACEAEQERLTSEQQPHLDAIYASRPSTLEGLKALANTMVVALDCNVLENHAAKGHTADRMMLALLYGLTGRE